MTKQAEEQNIQRLKELVEPDFEWEDLLPKVFRIYSESLPKNRSVKPKVNLLPDGRVELIYKSKM